MRYGLTGVDRQQQPNERKQKCVIMKRRLWINYWNDNASQIMFDEKWRGDAEDVPATPRNPILSHKTELQNSEKCVDFVDPACRRTRAEQT